MAENNAIDFEKQTVTEKLKGLYELQKIDSKVDEIILIKGELPLEVRDLEDGIAGLNTRKQNTENSIEAQKAIIQSAEISKKEAFALIEKYSEQLNHIKNNREYESLSREIEFQKLEIEYKDKKIREQLAEIEEKQLQLITLENTIVEYKENLHAKRKELKTIQKENKQVEEELSKKRAELIFKIEPRLQYAYTRIRNSVINRIAVAHIQKEACSGCNSKIPPQRQIDIRSNRKIITCEFCGRILVDSEILENEK